MDTYKELLEQDHEERQKQVASAVEVCVTLPSGFPIVKSSHTHTYAHTHQQKAEATFQETVAKLTKDVADAKRESAERELVFKQQVVDMDK